MSSDTEMSDISEISSSPEDDETGEGEEEDVEVIYSLWKFIFQFRNL